MSRRADRERVAREALAAHDALRATEEVEPELDVEGMPLDVDAWLAWRANVSEPAYARWSRAMDELELELGEPGMSRHPFTFRPRCLEILGVDADEALRQTYAQARSRRAAS